MLISRSPDWASRSTAILQAVGARCARAGLGPDHFGLVVMQPGAKGRPEGFAHRGAWRAYPCALVKPFHLVHALAALDEGRVTEHAELDRALTDMIVWSSNSAANYVIDTLTGTTGDTLLAGRALADWTDRRAALNRFFLALGWPEFTGCNIAQKLTGDRRYGREAQHAGEDGANLNALTPLAAARLMWALFEGNLPLSAAARARAQMTLWRDRTGIEASRPEFQPARGLGAGLPEGVDVWSKSGHNRWTGDPRTSWYRHDMIRLSEPGRPPLIMVLMTQGRAVAEGQPDLFADIGRMVWDMTSGRAQVRPALYLAAG